MFNYINTNETFTSINGTVVRYSDLFEGIKIQVASLVRKGFLSHDEADDAFQDAALKAIRFAGRFDETRMDSVQAYGAMIAKGEIFNKTRRNYIVTPEEEVYDDMDSKPRARYVKRQVEWDDSFMSGMDSCRYGRDEVYDAERHLLAAEKMEALSEALSFVSETNRTILELAGDEVKPAAIAKEVGLTPNAVYSRLCKNRKQVENCYNRFMAA